MKIIADFFLYTCDQLMDSIPKNYYSILKK